MAVEVRMGELTNSLREFLKLYYDMFVVVHELDEKAIDKIVEGMGSVNYHNMAACMKFLLRAFDRYVKREVGL